MASMAAPPDAAVMFSSPLKSSSNQNAIASPLSNLKLLTDVACAELYELSETESSVPLSQQSTISTASSCSFHDENVSPIVDDDAFGDTCSIRLESRPQNVRRGEKLSEICVRFLHTVPLKNLPKNQRPLLEMSAIEKSLGVERRRLYDILNILESLSIVERAQKNCMRWNGTSKLTHTITRLRSLAANQFTLDDLCYILDDIAFRKVYAENAPNSPEDNEASYEEVYCACAKKCNDSHCKNYEEDVLRHEEQENIERAVDTDNIRPCRLPGDDINVCEKNDRPLGIICQRFLILLLLQRHPRVISMQSALRLMKLDLLRQVEHAGTFKPSDKNADLKVKIAEMEKKKVSLIKTRSRRLYDVCNVLTALGVLKRARLIRFEMDCVTGFWYCGPDPETMPVVTPSPLVGTRQSLLCDQSPVKEETAKKAKSASGVPKENERRKGTFVRHLSLDDVVVTSSSSSTSIQPDNSSMLKQLLTPTSTVHMGGIRGTVSQMQPRSSSLKRHMSDGVVVVPSNPSKVKIVYLRPENPLYSTLVSSAPGRSIHVLTASQLQETLKNQNLPSFNE